MKNKSRIQHQKNDALKEIREGQSVDLLKDLHLLTSDGTLHADSRRKLKQVYHLIQLIERPLLDLIGRDAKTRVLDLGAGKSYLGLLLYDLILKHHPQAGLTGVEIRPELVELSRRLIEKHGFERAEISMASIGETQNREEGSLFVTALHACDLATDEAIELGLMSQAKSFALVPCCQAQMARELEKQGNKALEPLWSLPLHRREFSSHLTNVLRVLRLQSHGYRVTVTELVGWEHSLKNEFILAEKIGEPYLPAREKMLSLIDALGIGSLPYVERMKGRVHV